MPETLKYIEKNSANVIKYLLCMTVSQKTAGDEINRPY